MFTTIVPLGKAVTPQVTPQVRRLLLVLLTDPMTRAELQKKLHLADREHFRKDYLAPALSDGLIEMSIPDKPNSRFQKYLLTGKGQAALDQH